MPTPAAPYAVATPRNPLVGAVADALMKSKDPYKSPLGVQGGNLAGILLGQSPEVLDKMSYGEMPWSGGGLQTKLDPEALDLANLADPASMLRSALMKGVRHAIKPGVPGAPPAGTVEREAQPSFLQRLTQAHTNAEGRSRKISEALRGIELETKLQKLGYSFDNPPGQPPVLLNAAGRPTDHTAADPEVRAIFDTLATIFAK